MKKYFGTDGVRGLANEVLTPELAFCLGRAAAFVLLAEGRKKAIAIGKDTRLSGDMLEAALAAGICSAGAEAVLLGVIPTPAVSTLCRKMNIPGAVVSASHNHFSDNGIKFFSYLGYKLSNEEEGQIEALIENPALISRAFGENIGTISRLDNAGQLYLGELKELMPFDLSGLKIVVDAANGAASGLAKELFESLGGEVYSIYDTPDGCNINENCGSTKPKALIAEVLNKKADIGIALDGDADRIIAVDEKGAILNGDRFLAICAQELLEENKLKNKALVVTLMSNMALTIFMEKLGVQVYETQVGDRYVLEKMLEIGASLGGEQSGHIIFADYNTTGDGLAGALYLMNVLKKKNRPLSTLAEEITLYPQALINVPVTLKKGWEEDADIFAAYKNVAEKLKGRGRIVLRPSGTEELIRVMTEGENEEEILSLAQKVAAVIKNKRGK